ncbi:MAG: MerR family transcriptional regulator [Bacteroidales bacterium]
MVRFSIKDLERISGIKAHTLRMWERRYGFVVPKRTPTNIRYYDDEDLRILLNIVTLSRNGYKPGKLAGLSPGEIETKLLEVVGHDEDQRFWSDKLLMAMVNYDVQECEAIYRDLMAHFSVYEIFTSVFYPFLRRIGYLWQADNIAPAHEHFISALIRQKLITAIDNTPAPVPARPAFLLYLSEGDFHELRLLVAAYMLKSLKFPVIYLGASMPLSSLSKLLERKIATKVLTMISYTAHTAEVEGQVKKLSERFPDIEFIIGGEISEDFTGSEADKIKHVSTMKQFQELISSE